MRSTLPLIGLTEDGLLAGEQRTMTSTDLGRSSVSALAGHVGERVVLVTVTSPVELPGLVAQRWATEVEVLRANESEAELRGVRRVQIRAARGREGAFVAEVDPREDGPLDVLPVVRGARDVLDALLRGARPDVSDWETSLTSALLGLVRILGTNDDFEAAQRKPAAEALGALATLLAERSAAVSATENLERIARDLASPEVPVPTEGSSKGAAAGTALKRRLWSQVVEIQRKLDVYDPGVGKDGDDLGILQRRLMQAGMPKDARESAKRELRLLRSMATSHHDHATYFAHLDFMARLPWQPDVLPPANLEAVERALDSEHFGLGKAKTRVLEHLAVRELGGEGSSMVLCLSGPPGVGKTTVARSIATALGRKFVRVPLGGVHDESEIRGHRLSFVAASAGRLLRGLAQAGSSSAVVLLDEIDKVGGDRQRSPAAALLEALDPEQNGHFQDNYLGVPFDLSSVLFITTANDLSAMHPALRDRMEPVEIEGYTAEEKTLIATKHLLPRVAREVGLPTPPVVEPEALRALIDEHTSEAGVRQLKRALGEVYRARALSLFRSRPEPLPSRTDERTSVAPSPVTRAEIGAVLGPPRHVKRGLPERAAVGVSVGLSVSGDGGALLLLEVGLVPGKGKLHATGSLGKVMGESVQTALTYARMHAARLGLPENHADFDVHVHAPEGAIPKDGPSAGIALLVALVSAFRNEPPASDVAMTGEVSLSGQVLRVGGVKPKVLAAERAGVGRVLLPEGNLVDAPRDTRVVLVPVSHVDEALAAAFGPFVPAVGRTLSSRRGPETFAPGRPGERAASPKRTRARG
jgi:ATP-dependent Lon protease